MTVDTSSPVCVNGPSINTSAASAPAIDVRRIPYSQSRADDVPQWIRLACERWGRQKRRIWAGGDWYIDGQGLRRHHADGYAQSFLGRLLEERDGTGQGARNQHWPEVLWGDALDVQLAIPGMPLLCFDVLHLHFVFDPEFGLSAAKKAELAQVSRRSYWEVLQLAEQRIWGRLAPEQLREAFAIPLPIEWHPPKPRKSRKHQVGLMFGALKRPLLSLK